MTRHVRGAAVLAVLGAISVLSSTTDVSAQWFSRGCQHCQRPVTHCRCQTQQPVVETQMVPQQVTTYRNEVLTQYRQEAYTQSVPVTTYRDVVVDEGAYQTVYVPKHVTKRVPQVTYQQQVAYRSVPYQVTRQVPQVVTRMVSQPTVQARAISYQTVSQAPIGGPAYAPPIAVAPCGPCGSLTFAPVPVCAGLPVMSHAAVASPVVVANPVTMLTPTSIASTTVVQGDAPAGTGPVPDPKFLDSPGASPDSWTTVGSRRDNLASTASADDARTAGSGGIRFKPARTVYQSWESQSRLAGADLPERR